MERFLSIIYLYNKASWQKLTLIIAVLPLGFLITCLWNVGIPTADNSLMLLERAFGGITPVLIFIGVMMLALLAVANTLNGRKDLKATHTTIGFTLRRMHSSPIGAYISVFLYYFVVMTIIWAVAILSFFIIGQIGLFMTDAKQMQTSLALGLLRTDIGHALLPIAHPLGLIFNLVVAASVAGECAKSCYLTWHNGSPSAGVALITVAMVYVWTFDPDNTFILLTILFLALYGSLSIADVIFREKRPKGDPFKVNKYAGVIDMNSTDFDEELYLEVNSSIETFDPKDEAGYLKQYGRDDVTTFQNRLKRLNPFWLRRRFMPLGSNMEKANAFFGLCIFLGFGEHLLFFGRYQMEMKALENSMKGVTIDSGLKMPYFWELEEHTYYGYIVAMVLVLMMQMYWNWAYYNKETKSVYVMKRLPNWKEYPRTIWVSPVIQAVLIALFAAAHTLIDFCLYLTTPDLALHADYLTHIFPF